MSPMPTFTPRRLFHSPWPFGASALLAGGMLGIGLLAAGPGRADVPTAPTQVPPPVLAHVRFLPVDGGAQLVPGDVPLQVRDRHAFLGLFERAFDFTLPERERASLGAAFVQVFREAGALERQVWLQLVDPYEQVLADELVDRDAAANAALERFRGELDARLAAGQGSAIHAAVSRTLERARAPYWNGVPPIDEMRAASYLEASAFVAVLGRNEAFSLTPGQSSILDESARSALFHRADAERRAVVEVASLWRRVRERWDGLGDVAQDRTRFAAAVLLARLVPPDALRAATSGVLPVVASRADYATLATATRMRQQGPFSAIVDVARNPRHVAQVLAAVFDADVAPLLAPLAER